MRFVLLLSLELKVPIVPHFGDDWPATIYRSGLASGTLRRRAERYLAAIFERSPIRLVISDMMGAEYRKRYGGTYLTFLNTVDKSSYLVNDKGPTTGPISFVYIGGLHSGRWEALRAIGLELKKLNEIGISGHLSIFTYPQEARRYQTHLIIPPVSEVKGWVPNNEVPRVLGSADVLVHVESFRGEIPDIVRLSVSTKIPEYMMAGRSLLGFGPGNIASIGYIRDSHSGLTVETEDRTVLQEALETLICNHEKRVVLGKNARSTALMYHDSEGQRRLFADALKIAARFRDREAKGTAYETHKS
jgi:glycosyltransferase involved in cell wall biosynthesis